VRETGVPPGSLRMLKPTPTAGLLSLRTHGTRSTTAAAAAAAAAAVVASAESRLTATADAGCYY